MDFVHFGQGPLPGTPGHWDASSGKLPPLLADDLAKAGVDPTDPAAVIAYYKAADNGTDGEPYWLPVYAEAHGIAL
jgi:hypothetical protein